MVRFPDVRWTLKPLCFKLPDTGPEDIGVCIGSTLTSI